jgi:signal transduction histidine kinase/ActR/RegA family two-component response regulator
MISHLTLLCDLDGRVHEVLLKTHDIAPPSPGAALTELIDESGHTKLTAFLEELHRAGYAAGWELLMRSDAAPLSLAGARIGDRLLIFATMQESDLIAIIKELGRLNNEQSNALRAAIKETCEQSRPITDLVLEMTRLNSDLTTTQRELTRQNHALQRLIREKNELLGMVAHDLRNPLAGIFGVAEQLAHQADQGASNINRDMLDYLQHSSRHLLAQIEDLLDLSTVEAGVVRLNLETTDLLALLARSLRLARELASDKKITIHLEERATDAPNLRAAALDPHKITQALTNLLTNAIKFSPPGGAVLLRLSERDGSARVTVQDHGVGIAPDRVAGIFEPFQRGQPGTLGEPSTGLGLAIVRRIIRAHGGEVQVESELGRGTTFTLTLPLRPSAAPSAPTPAPSQATPTSPHLAVLIADDDPINNLLLARALEDRGHHVTAVSDTLGVLDRVAAAHFDLIIVDLEMPGGGGARVAQHLSARPLADRPPLIALTAHSAARAAGFAEQHRFDAVLSKPLRGADLDAALAQLLPGSGAAT